jgi:hypothetical protein
MKRNNRSIIITATIRDELNREKKGKIILTPTNSSSKPTSDHRKTKKE